MKEYICTVTAAALIVSVLVSLAGRGQMRPLVKFVAGVFMALTAISPLLKLELPDMTSWTVGLEAEGQEAAEAGKALADDAMGTIIMEHTRTYIMDKAARYGVSVEVDVELDDSGIPVGVTLTGEVSPYAKDRLSREMAAELGLKEEVQRWISGNYTSG